MRPRGTKLFLRFHRAFTLAEVLAALALMAIIIPVAMHGVQIATRAGTLGQRKVTASRIAERVLNELIVTNGSSQSATNGTASEDGISYPWTAQTQTWPEDPMSVLTVRVTFTVQGNSYDVSVSTLYDPAATTTTSTGS